ncbi:MAG TPA: tRNA (adenosine(37)-N6)-dimethylallyltransferase MiaA [Woeseiaceae bacterium]|jgi:tRNA dimethylallyltransferase|nr:tRNA (adenosine(37)-N6)-dimethylallyltransferase MiaA [Woeseiaceae bacterium]
MRKAVCLMGPTASGKTDVAVRLCERFPFDVISVDSALVYRGMDIGTAKPDAETLRRVPHRLVDIRDPEEGYSAGDFVRDAAAEIDAILAAGRIPLLVGGTMLYFRSLTEGIAELPAADAAVRAAIDAEAEIAGWPALHARLGEADPEAAERIKPNDKQRIQRALEVYRSTGRTLSEWQNRGATGAMRDVEFCKMALLPASREILHERIELRLKTMFNNGLIDEVKVLYNRPELTAEHPSMRSVGYRQVWQFLAGGVTLGEASDKALYATRQLAKRQITWLRSEAGLNVFDPLEPGVIDAISTSLLEFLDA